MELESGISDPEGCGCHLSHFNLQALHMLRVVLVSTEYSVHSEKLSEYTTITTENGAVRQKSLIPLNWTKRLDALVFSIL